MAFLRVYFELDLNRVSIDVRVVRSLYSYVFLSVRIYRNVESFQKRNGELYRNKHIMIDLGTGNNNKM